MTLSTRYLPRSNLMGQQGQRSGCHSAWKILHMTFCDVGRGDEKVTRPSSSLVAIFPPLTSRFE